MFEVRRLDSICEITMGQAPDGGAYNDDGYGWPLIAGAGDFGEHHPSPKKFTKEASKISKPGDIVLGIRATIGEKVISDSEYCLGRGVAGIRPKSELDTRFLWHWLSHIKPQLSAKGKGATFKQVNKQDIGELEVSLPPLPEQRRIAAVLDKADALRAKRRESLAQLDELTQSIFIEMFGDPATNPKGWPTYNLGDYVKVLGGYAFKSDDFETEGCPIVRISNLTGDGVDLTNAARIPSDKIGKGKDYRISSGDILIAMSGATTGKLGVAPKNMVEPIYLNQRVGSFKVKDARKINRTFLLYFLRSSYYQRFIWGLAAGAAQPNISGSQLESVQMPLPTFDKQTEFEISVENLSRLRGFMTKAVEQSEDVFCSLQHSAFLGEL